MQKTGRNRDYITMKRDISKTAAFAAAFSLIILALTFLSDRNTFVFPDKTDDRYTLALTDYGICKILALIVLFAAFYGLFTIVFAKNEYRDSLISVIKCGALYLPVLVSVAAIKLPQGFLTNDEYAIYENATNLVHDTWFNYMTVYYYIVSLMLIPVKYGPIIMKLIIEFFVVGYCVYRAKSYYGKKAGMFMYVLFVLYPVIAYTTSAHRLPVYFLIYLALFVKIHFDLLEKKDITTGGMFLILLSGTVLTQWRTEGIYLLALIPIVLFIAYPSLRNKKAALCVIASYIVIQYIISIPQNGMSAGTLSGAANDRMKPFYAYTITNMMRNGLDEEKNAAELEVIDKYISIDAIKNINEYYWDNNYEDVLILIKEEFGGVRPDAGYTEYYDFTEAVKKIFMNEPGVFLKTRWGAFCFAAQPYRLTLNEGAVHAVVSAVKSLSYNLFVPVILAFAFALISLVRRKWFMFFCSGGLLAHWFIVFILAPASYFKYYFPVYIMSYYFVLMMLIWYFAGRKKNLTCPMV